MLSINIVVFEVPHYLLFCIGCLQVLNLIVKQPALTSKLIKVIVRYLTSYILCKLQLSKDVRKAACQGVGVEIDISNCHP